MGLATDLTRLLGIEPPIVRGSFGPWTSVELSAAVSEAGGLGSIGTAEQGADLVPFGGQTAGVIDAVLTVREIVGGMVAQARERIATLAARTAGVPTGA